MTEITLPVGASAEHNTCGSCKFFQRKQDWTAVYGDCRIKLPPTVAKQSDVRAIDPKRRNDEYTGNEDRIKDTERCDFYKHDQKVYIVQRKVGAIDP